MAEARIRSKRTQLTSFDAVHQSHGALRHERHVNIFFSRTYEFIAR